MKRIQIGENWWWVEKIIIMQRYKKVCTLGTNKIEELIIVVGIVNVKSKEFKLVKIGGCDME